MNTPNPERPSVSVIIPCRNEAACIESCLSSALMQEMPDGGCEIVVADGMSKDGTREILARMEREANAQSPRSGVPILRLVDNPGLVASCGLNAAIGVARGDIIVRMDAHSEYARDYIVQCVSALESTGADNVGGPARTKAHSYIENAVAAAYHSPFSVGGARFHNVNYEGPVDTVTYGCWRRETFNKFGYFDEKLVRNQDDEHNLRIIRGRGKIWQSPKIKSWYRPRGSLSALFKQYLQYGYWKVRVIQKHKLPASWRHLVPGGFVLVLLLLFLLSAFGCMFSLPILGFHFSFQGSFLTFYSLLLLALILSLYGLCILAASGITAAKTQWKLLPVLPLVFACYHFGYGWGFLKGLADFVLLRRNAAEAFTSLTRSSEPSRAKPGLKA
jgi:glycosyltransferase involved in cell wall biosynthesis